MRAGNGRRWRRRYGQGGTGNDTCYDYGVAGSFGLGLGDDTSYHDGIGTVTVSMGDGSDTFYDYSAGGGTVDLGAGSDTPGFGAPVSVDLAMTTSRGRILEQPVDPALVGDGHRGCDRHALLRHDQGQCAG